MIKNQDNKLFAIANNQGAKIANGEYLLLLNSDTVISDDVIGYDNIDGLVRYFDSLPDKVICIGPKILNKDYTIQSQGMSGLSHWDTISRHFKLGSLLPPIIANCILPPGTYRYNSDKTHDVSWVLGACMLCRANKYNEVGGLNENLEFYGEEPEFGYRTLKRGYITKYVPEFRIIHLGGGSTTKDSESEAEKIKSLRRYALIVRETVGYRYAINTSRITKLAYQMKKVVADKTAKQHIDQLISYEDDVIKYLRTLLKN